MRLLLWAALAAAAVRAGAPPPVDVFPGAVESKAKSRSYMAARQADDAWVFVARAGFDKVKAFYRSRLHPKGSAESLTEKRYVVAGEGFEVRIEKGKAGRVWIKIAKVTRRPADEKAPPEEPPGEKSDALPETGGSDDGKTGPPAPPADAPRADGMLGPRQGGVSEGDPAAAPAPPRTAGAVRADGTLGPPSAKAGPGPSTGPKDAPKPDVGADQRVRPPRGAPAPQSIQPLR